ncbi:hypothetical protein HOM98_02995 [Candidatus Peregrinibacteria bacterium]|nr:hypothetical protein [Candidatus Peregrinibacteria bacterium]
MNLPIKSGEMRRDEENKRKLLSAAKRRVLEWIYGFVDQYDLSVDWVYQLFLNQAEAQFELEFHNFDDDEWGPWVERVLKVVENRRCGWSHALKVAIEMEVTQYSL